MELSKYLGVFIEEAKEHIQNLNDGLLALGEGQQAVIDEVFRSAHTLKGMSATMGFTEVAELTHTMENVFDRLRQGGLHYSEDLGDTLFQCLDAIERFVNEVGPDMVPPIHDYGVLVKRLDEFAQAQSVIPMSSHSPAAETRPDTLPPLLEANTYEKSILQAAMDKGLNVFHIVVRLRPDCLLKSARAFMVFQAIERSGEIIKSVPDVTAIEDEQFDSSFELLIVTDQPREAVAQSLDSVSEVEQVEIIAYTLDAPPEAASSEPKEVQKGQSDTDVAKRLKTGRTVRVDISRLDSLMNLMSEMVINKTRINEISHSLSSSDLSEATNQLNRIAADLQNLVMQVRMVPIEQVFSRFPRMVRDLARDLGKEINLVVEGEETELDRTVIDEIGEPILHLIRNAVDHGIENPQTRQNHSKPSFGTVKLSAFPHGHTVVIEIEDDGRGMDVEAITKKALERGFVTAEELTFMDSQERMLLIFRPGFSTADKISDVSGRGVGLDVVKTQVESLGGSVELVTKPGQGSKFIISLPLTLAILQSLLVQVGLERYAIPLSSIDQTFALDTRTIKTVRGQEVTLYRGSVLPLLRLQMLLDVPSDHQELQENFVVVLKRNDKKLGLVVDQLVGHQEIVIKSLGKFLGGIKGIAGATILGDGQIALILDVPSLF